MIKKYIKSVDFHDNLGDLKFGVALRIFGVALIVGEKGVALKVGETAASHLTPLT